MIAFITNAWNYPYQNAVKVLVSIYPKPYPATPPKLELSLTSEKACAAPLAATTGVSGYQL